MLAVNDSKSPDIKPLDSFHVINLSQPLAAANSSSSSFSTTPHNNNNNAVPELARSISKPLLSKLAPPPPLALPSSPPPSPPPPPSSIATTTTGTTTTAAPAAEDSVFPEIATRRRSDNMSGGGVYFSAEVHKKTSLTVGGTARPMSAAAEEGKIRRASRKSIKWAPEDVLVSEVVVKQTHHQMVAAEIQRQERRKSLFSCFCFGNASSSSGGDADRARENDDFQV